MEAVEKPIKRGTFGAILLFAIGAIYLSDWLREPSGEVFKLMAGISALLIAQHTYLHPGTSWRDSLRPTNVSGWLAWIGAVLLIIAVITRFF